jgi:hypothetical protein
MTILTSLLIATQGLLPSPTPLSIGTQGLLQIAGAPPPPPVVGRDLPGAFGRIEDRKVVVKITGTKATLRSSNLIEIVISACVDVAGTIDQIAGKICAPSVHLGAIAEVAGNVQNFSAMRVKPTISTSFTIVGCAQEDEAQIRALAQAALERFILDSIQRGYDD